MSTALRELNLSPEQLLADLPVFLTSLTALMETLSVDLTAYQADHIALRVNSWSVAEALHQAWLEYGEEWSNNEINGRPIVIIGLHQPLQFGQWQIEAIELPYPKSGKVYAKEGWEHVEWVIPHTHVDSLMAWETHLQRVFPTLNKTPTEWGALGIKVKASSPSGDKERLANPTVAYNKDNVCLKLHPCSLKAVLDSEQ